jgi:hypothetical protein
VLSGRRAVRAACNHGADLVVPKVVLVNPQHTATDPPPSDGPGSRPPIMSQAFELELERLLGLDKIGKAHHFTPGSIR